MTRPLAAVALAAALAACQPIGDELADGSRIVGYEWNDATCPPPADPCRYWYAIVRPDGTVESFELDPPVPEPAP